MRKNSTDQLLRRLPAKWAIGLVVLAIGYTLIQPLLNRQLAWNLPSIASLNDPGGQARAGEATPAADDVASGDNIATADEIAQAGRDATEGSGSASQQGRDAGGTQFPNRSEPNASSRPQSKVAEKESRSGSNSERGPPSEKDAADSPVHSTLRYGVLKEIGNERYVSPKGLVYGPGSQEGHRLKHIERHLEDQPQRSGSHGVFYGDMAQVVRWLDDTYTRARDGAKGTKLSKEGQRTVMEASFQKPVGYVGGQNGKRKGNPDARSIRLVVEGTSVITAFPF